MTLNKMCTIECLRQREESDLPATTAKHFRLKESQQLEVHLLRLKNVTSDVTKVRTVFLIFCISRSSQWLRLQSFQLRGSFWKDVEWRVSLQLEDQ